MVGERIVTYTLAAAATAVAVAVVHREFWNTPTAASAVSASVAPEFVKNWKNFARVGISTGDTAAKIQVFEFVDFECPYCKAYEGTLQAVERRYGHAVSRVFIHYPLPGHRFSRAAALAAECAHDQSRFSEMKAALYAKQDSFGLRPWTAYALDAQIPDRRKFEMCVTKENDHPRIDGGLALARSLNLRGTPSIIVNGWRFVISPPDSILSRAIDDLLVGKSLQDGAR